MELIAAFSPCPNDTYIFDALINQRIDTNPYRFIPHIADVEELNMTVADYMPDITKLSVFAYLKLTDKYQILTAGSAIGENCGPLLISKHKIFPDEIADCKTAIPGKNTTAFLLLNILFPELKNSNKIREYLFSDIEEVVLSDECDAGLIIHETRFTYKTRGLKLIADLGKKWETKYNLPLPLGLIAVKRNLNKKIKTDIDKLLLDSIKFADANPSASHEYILKHSQVKDTDIIRKHINLYVNHYTKNIGETGRKAITKLASEALELGMIDKIEGEMFL
jgi:1,4-dihydroxy-6-naphthoate synthase